MSNTVQDEIMRAKQELYRMITDCDHPDSDRFIAEVNSFSADTQITLELLYLKSREFGLVNGIRVAFTSKNDKE